MVVDLEEAGSCRERLGLRRIAGLKVDIAVGLEEGRQRRRSIADLTCLPEFMCSVYSLNRF